MTTAPDIMKAARELWRSLQTVSEHAWPEDAATTQDIERIATALQSERSSAAAEIERLLALVKEAGEVVRPFTAWAVPDKETVSGYRFGVRPKSSDYVNARAFLDKLEGR